LSRQSSVSVLDIRGVLLPLWQHQLLLPNAAVSEVVTYEEPNMTLFGAPDWMLGTQVWRQQIIPMISFERMLGMNVDTTSHRARLAICNTMSGNIKRPYIGIQLKTIPHLARVTIDNISVIDEPQRLGDAVLHQVKIGNEYAIIPNMDWVEETLAEFIS